MKNYLIDYDANRLLTDVIPQSDTIYNVVLSANVEQTITVPTGATIVTFSADKNFYCRFDGSVVVPVSNILNGTGGEINPDKRSVRGITEIHLIATATTVVTLSFFSVPRQPFVESGFPSVR